MTALQMTMEDQVDLVLDVLGMGLDEIKSSHAISDETGLPQRHIGFVVSRMRKQGMLIGSAHGLGYYIISDEDELESTIEHIEARKRGIDLTVLALRESYAEQL